VTGRRAYLCDVVNDGTEDVDAAGGGGLGCGGVFGSGIEEADAADGLARGGSGGLEAANAPANAIIRSLSISAVRNRLCVSFMRAAGDCGPMEKDMNKYSQLSKRLERSPLHTFSEHSLHANHRAFSVGTSDHA